MPNLSRFLFPDYFFSELEPLFVRNDLAGVGRGGGSDLVGGLGSVRHSSGEI